MVPHEGELLIQMGERLNERLLFGEVLRVFHDWERKVKERNPSVTG